MNLLEYLPNLKFLSVTYFTLNETTLEILRISKIVPKIELLLLRPEKANETENSVVEFLKLICDAKKIIIKYPFFFDSSKLVRIGSNEIIFNQIHGTQLN